jgi:hypothetical protein
MITPIDFWHKDCSIQDWQVEKDMRKIVGISIMIAVMLTGSYGLSLAGSKATITVSANVMASISQTVFHQESKLNVTEEDVKRGFIEINSATILQVKTNERRGYVLFFEGGNDIIKEVWVKDKVRTIVLSSNGGLVHQPYSGNLELKDLSYKLLLKENIQPGLYSWPLRVRASLL